MEFPSFFFYAHISNKYLKKEYEKQNKVFYHGENSDIIKEIML